MRNVKIKVDLSRPYGKMRNILGMNNSPTLCYKPRTTRQLELFRNLNPACVRHHDAALESAGYSLIDVSRIFPLFHLDENDPRNYNFQQTDDYLSLISDYPIEFRLGESIDHSGFARLVNPPADYRKWARICLNILRHYKDGWADGMHLNIQRVSVWEEPDTVPTDSYSAALFTGTPEQYYDLFADTYKILHEVYPDLLIGGPNCNADHPDVYKGFLVHCKKAGIEPGFVAVTAYTRDLDIMIDMVDEIRQLLDRHEFFNTGISISEWHLGPSDSWGERAHHGFARSGFDRAVNAAFSSSALIGLMDKPIDYAFFYSWAYSVWRTVNVMEEVMEPLPVYYGLKYFTDITTTTKTRFFVECSSSDGVYAMAGHTEDDRVQLLLSAYQVEASEFVCQVPGYHTCKVRSVVDGKPKNEMSTPKEMPVEGDGSFRVVLPHHGSGVFFLEFRK